MARSRRDPGSLRERFGQNHARHERIAGEMPGEHRIVRRKKRHAFRGAPGLAMEQLPNENKRRPMWQTERGGGLSR